MDKKAKFKKGQLVKAPISSTDSVIGKIYRVTYIPYQKKYHYAISGKRISDGTPWTIIDIEETQVKSTRQNAMKTRKTTTKAKKATSKKATTTTKKAKKILDAQKREWKRIWKEEVSGRRNPQEAAERAGQRYRLEYGATPKARWKNALAKAKKA